MPPRTPTPPGFVLLGMLLATLAAGCTIAVTGPRTVLAARALFALVAIVSLVVVEALWWVRPWLVPAADAWMVACIGAALFSSLAAGWGRFDRVLGAALLALCFVGLPCTVVHWYVRDRALRLGLAPGIVP